MIWDFCEKFSGGLILGKEDFGRILAPLRVMDTIPGFWRSYELWTLFQDFGAPTSYGHYSRILALLRVMDTIPKFSLQTQYFCADKILFLGYVLGC